jgi:hypothetical protein
VTDDEIRARFDGRSRVELLLGPVSASQRDRVEQIAHALGYRLLSMHPLRAGSTSAKAPSDLHPATALDPGP